MISLTKRRGQRSGQAPYDAFAGALRSILPGGVLGYELAEPCENCTKIIHITEGRAPWGLEGFLGQVFWGH